MRKSSPKATSSRVITSFCHASSNCCPVLAIDTSAPADKCVTITDDFGGRVQMSREQIAGFIEKVKAGTVSL